MKHNACEDCIHFDSLFYNNGDFGKCCKHGISVFRRATITCRYFKKRRERKENKDERF